jgi:hypothetical protein
VRWFDEVENIVVPDIHFDKRQRPARAFAKAGTFAISPDSSFWQPHQIAGSGSEGEGPANPFEPLEPGLALSGHGLDPAEGLFNPLSDMQAHGVAGMARRASIDRGAAAADVAGQMRRHLHRAQLVDEVLGRRGPCRRLA